MTELSHALEVIDTLTDSLKLKKRVELSINHDHDYGNY